ncbi:MAG: ROK family protein [Actinomycetota bacterium]
MSSLAGATQDEVRRSNLSLVLTLLHRHGAQSRSQIVATTGLNRSTVGDLVSELVEVGLVRESAGISGGVGRPSLRVEPVAEAATVLALDMRVERTVAAVVGLGGEVFARREQHYAGATQHDLVAEVCAITRRVIAEGPGLPTWVGTGIGVPGVVRTEDGLVRFAPNLGWVDVPMGVLVQEAFNADFGAGRPVAVRNDSDLGVLAEQVRGAASDADNVIYLSGDVGIGGGLLIDGRPLVGAGGYGGEVGHMRVNPSGQVCRCGAIGCWETEIGQDAILRKSGAVDVDEAIERAAAGDVRAREALAEVAAWLGIGLANLVNIANPQAVVLGGHLGSLYASQPSIVDHQVGSALPAPREQVRLVGASLGADGTLIGASEVAFTGLLADPIGVLARLEQAS